MVLSLLLSWISVVFPPANSNSARVVEPIIMEGISDAVALSVDPSGNIFVVDAGAHMLLQFSPQGTKVSEIGGFGWGQLEFDRPVGVCARNGLDIFVADYGNHRIQRFNRRLQYIGTLQTRDSPVEGERFGFPRAVTVTRFGDLLVLDGENNRILKFSGLNKMERAFGGIDAGRGRLVNPLRIAVGESDEIYVLEPARVVAFDNFGNYLRSIGTDTLKNASGIAVSRSSIFVAEGADLFEFTTTGAITSVTKLGEIVSHSRDLHAVDIAADETHIVVLLPQAIHILRRSD